MIVAAMSATEIRTSMASVSVAMRLPANTPVCVKRENTLAFSSVEKRNNRANPQHCGRSACNIQEHENPDAPDSRADQIRPVDLSDRVGAARQGKAHDDARKEKRNGEAERE